MRIFQLCGDMGIAPDGTKGASVHFRSLNEALRRQGHDVTAFTVRTATQPEVFRGPWRRFDSADSVVAEAERAGRPDCVYERYSLGATAGLDAALRLDVPFVLEVNAPLVLEAARHRPETVRPEHGVSERLLFTDADAVAVVSTPLKTWIEETRGAGGGVSVIPNGFEPEAFGSAPAPTKEDPPVLAFLGHPKPWHGAPALVPLAEEIGRIGRRARVVIIGGGEGAEAVRRAAEARGVADRFEITGALSHAAAITRLRAATIAVAPYPADPCFYFCPIKLLEAAAAGVPVVTTDQGDLKDLVGPGGILTPPGDDAAFRRAVVELLDDPARCEALGRAGREHAFRRFTWDAAAAAVVRLIRGVKGRRAGRVAK